MKEFDRYINRQIKEAMETFLTELNTDENLDYRRGYKAGWVVASLCIKDAYNTFNEENKESI